MFQGFSTAVPIPRPTRSQTAETRSKSTVSGSQNVMVGRARFELAVSWSQTRRFTELSYRPRNGRMTPLSLTLSPMGRGEYSNRQLLERARREHRPDRPGSVAVLGLLFWSHLPERPPRLRDQEHRVVPEARNTPPLRDDLAAALALEKRCRPPRRRQCDRACESRQPRAWMARKTIQKHLRPLLLRRANASRVNAWIPLQHVDLDARVVTDSRQLKRRPRRLRLQRGILGVSRTHLGHIGIDRHQLPPHARQQRSILPQLSRIASGNDQPALSQVWRWLASARRSAL